MSARGNLPRHRASASIVTSSAGEHIAPDSLLMKSLCNADNVASVDRGRYLIGAGASL